MLLFNEQHQPLNIEDIKAEFANLDTTGAPDEQEVENALGEYYQKALQLEGNKFQFQASFAPAAEAMGLFPIGKGILDAIKKAICSVLNDNSTSEEILSVILDALASIIPGGIFIKHIAQLLVKFIFAKGIKNFCAI
jgi:hypothetical protein